MPQKVLAGRADDPELRGALVHVRVDQVVLSAEPQRTLRQVLGRSLKRVKVETALAYESHCITSDAEEVVRLPRAAVRTGIQIGRAGIGYPAAVHLERFAAPGRLALTDDLRLASLGAIGMLTLVASPAQLAEVLIEGWACLRPVTSVQVLLSGKLRPFSCVKDAALELRARGLAATVREVDRKQGLPVVLEFAGPSARLLSVPERAVLCSLASSVGAAGALFVSDARTEAYLRDQRRSKAQRSLLPDPGAPCAEVVTLDLSTVDPLLVDGDGRIRSPRELQDQPVQQVVLGGDDGASLRDLLTAAALLKSKRIPPGLDFLVLPPSRQALEVLAQNGALMDLIATGARLLEPDQRVISQELYPPPSGGVSLRSFEPLPGPQRGRALVASAETLAYAVATGCVGDPRNFKRPARVTIPRTLPTEDVLVVRREKGKKPDTKSEAYNELPEAPLAPFEGCLDLAIDTALKVPSSGNGRSTQVALVLSCLDEVCWAAAHAPQLTPGIRALISTELPTALVPRLSGAGLLALTCSEQQMKQLRSAKTLALPRLSADSSEVEVAVGTERLTLTWAAIEEERTWVLSGGVGNGAKPKAANKA